ncbi:Esa1p-associated factor, partial [Sticta canariensis]|nr:Esa1p-associated factor [Sticta canariensis]
MAPSSHQAYAKDERVLCFHHELLYEAKVLESKLSDPADRKSAPQYLVHYKGWKNTWDDWVPQDRLRKLNDENRELAKNLKKEMDHLRQRAAPKATTVSSKKKAAGSDLSSTRGSEERNSSVPATGRGQKRGRDFEIEKVGDASSPLRASSVSGQDSPLDPSPVSSPGFLGSPKDIKRENSTDDRSSLYSWESPEPPLKRLCESPASDCEKSANGCLPPKAKEPSLSSASHSAPSLPPTALRSLPDDALGSSSDLSSAPPSPPLAKVEPEERGLGRGLRRGRPPGKKNRQVTHEIFGNAILGTRTRSRNDPMGIYGEHLDYPCKRLDNMMHRRLEYPRLEANPYTEPHKAIKKDPRACAAKRYFFQGQDSSAVLVIAGVPLEERETMFPPALDSNPSGRKPPGRKPRGSKKKKPPPKKNGKVDNSPMQEEAFHSRPSVRIVVPDHLKSILVDDWENVTKNLSLVPLPSAHPVNEILTTYFDEEKGKRRLGSAEADLLEEVVAGVREYFEKCLGRILLYRFEREQFFEIRQMWEHGVGEWEGKGAGDVYGAEHLCRLFVSMPELIAQTNMDQQSVNRLREELAKLTQWLGKNSARFFTTEYETASAEYIEKAR